jgi:hypothetical protein
VICGFAASAPSVSLAADGSSNDSAAVLLSAMMVVSVCKSSRRSALKRITSHASRRPLASTRATALVAVMTVVSLRRIGRSRSH